MGKFGGSSFNDNTRSILQPCVKGISKELNICILIFLELGKDFYKGPFMVQNHDNLQNYTYFHFKIIYRSSEFSERFEKLKDIIKKVNVGRIIFVHYRI